MFFKKIEFTSLLAFTRFFSANLINKRITTLSVILSTAVLILTIITFNSILIRAAMMSLSFFFIAYWTVSIFVYLYKKSQYGVFSRIIQRFWKRALWLFWMLELFLFSIYLFLAIISPQEVSYMLDNSQLVFDITSNLGIFFKNLTYALIIVLLANLQLLMHKFNMMRAAVASAIGILLLRAVFEDFVQFYTINNFYNSFTWSHSGLELADTKYSTDAYTSKYSGVWELESIELKNRTICHYYYLLIFLKLWHTVFIFIFFLFFENINWRSTITSYNTLAANLQNFYFLMFFNYILKIALFKQYGVYLGTYVYYWFYLNPNGYDFSYVYSLFSVNYFFFAKELFICL